MEFMTIEKIIQNNHTRALLTENYLIEIVAKFPWLLEMDATKSSEFKKLQATDFVAACAEIAGVVRMMNNNGYKGYQDAIRERREKQSGESST